MSFNKYDNEIDMNLFASILKDAVSKVKTEENPEVLTDLRKVYKKNVPFTLRLYVASYLAKLAMGSRSSYRPRRETRDVRQSRDWKSKELREPATEKRSVSEDKEREPRTPRVQIDSALATTIFVGIGRNRRVYPRDLVGLLVSVAQLDRDRIGDIRVLANYSFVQLFSEDADKVIAALNGYDYRGRKLTVSYSRQKDSEMEEESPDAASEIHNENSAAPVSASGTDSNDESAEDAAAYAAAEKAAADKEPFSAPESLV